MVTMMRRSRRVLMMLVRLAVMVAAIAVVMRPSVIVMMIRDFGMYVEVRPVITVVPVPDRALCGRYAGIDPQAICLA
jgi:hypothetical protein